MMKSIWEQHLPSLGKLLPLLLFPLLLWTFRDEFLSLKGMNFPSLLEVLPLCSLLLLSAFLNWATEAWKWHLLGKDRLGLTRRNAFKGVLAGLSIGMWMPGRVGAWLGKLFFVPKEQRSKALYPLLVSGAAQFFVTFSFAAVALTAWHMLSAPSFPFDNALITQAFLFSLLFPLGAFFLYRFLQSAWGRKLIEWSGMPAERVLSFRDLPPSLYAKVLGVASLRYLIILAQFLFVLRFWVPGFPPHLCLFAVPLVLFMVSVLPSMVLAKLGVREWLMVAVMAPLVGHERELLLSSFSIWLVNLAVPALVGVFVFLSSQRSRQPEASWNEVP